MDSRARSRRPPPSSEGPWEKGRVKRKDYVGEGGLGGILGISDPQILYAGLMYSCTYFP